MKPKKRTNGRKTGTTLVARGVEGRIPDRLRRELGAVEAASPEGLGALTTEELQRAAALSGFVAADAGRLPTEELEKRLRAVAGSGDRAAMFAWAHHAEDRVEEDSEAFELVEVVAELRRALDPERERKLEEARKAVEEACELKDTAYYRRRGVDGAYGLYAQQAYGNIAASVRGS